MQSKISVALLKGKNVGKTSDINKMAVHLEQILTEKDGVDLKIRQTLTDPVVKSADYIIFCGYDCGLLSEMFKVLELINSKEADLFLFLYEEPGESPHREIDQILTSAADIGRVDPKLYDRIINTTSYRDIIGYIDVSLKKLGSAQPAQNNPKSEV